MNLENKLGFLHFNGGEGGKGGKSGTPHLHTYSFSHTFLTNVHMKRFHTKFPHHRIINPDFRILEGKGVGGVGVNFKVQTYFHQLRDRTSTLCLEIFVGNDLILYLKYKYKQIMPKLYFFCREKNKFWKPKSADLLEFIFFLIRSDQ